MAAKRDPIRKIELSDGRLRYRFVVDVGRRTDGGRDQRTYTFDSLKEARIERARIISEHHQGVYVKPNRSLTVEQFFTEWLETKETKKPATRQSYLDALRPMLRAYGSMPLQQLDVPDLEKIKKAMLDGSARRVGRPGPLSPRSVNLMLTVVGMGLKVAVKRGMLPRNVAELVDRAPSDDSGRLKRGSWQTEHARAFLRHVREDRLYAAWLLSIFGLRRGEVLGLTWDALDLTGELAEARRTKGPSLLITDTRGVVAGVVMAGTPKAKASARVLPLPALLVHALTAHRAAQERERRRSSAAHVRTGLVVVDVMGRPYRPEWYSKRFVALSGAAGLPRIPLHGLRHVAASLMGDLGVPDVVIAAWLGQAQVTVTHGYMHAQADRMAEASTALATSLAERDGRRTTT
jgi:integrase